MTSGGLNWPSWKVRSRQRESQEVKSLLAAPLPWFLAETQAPWENQSQKHTPGEHRGRGCSYTASPLTSPISRALQFFFSHQSSYPSHTHTCFLPTVAGVLTRKKISPIPSGTLPPGKAPSPPSLCAFCAGCTPPLAAPQRAASLPAFRCR